MGKLVLFFGSLFAIVFVISCGDDNKNTNGDCVIKTDLIGTWVDGEDNYQILSADGGYVYGNEYNNNNSILEEEGDSGNKWCAQGTSLKVSNEEYGEGHTSVFLLSSDHTTLLFGALRQKGDDLEKKWMQEFSEWSLKDENNPFGPSSRSTFREIVTMDQNATLITWNIKMEDITYNTENGEVLSSDSLFEWTLKGTVDWLASGGFSITVTSFVLSEKDEEDEWWKIGDILYGCYWENEDVMMVAGDDGSSDEPYNCSSSVYKKQ